MPCNIKKTRCLDVVSFSLLNRVQCLFFALLCFCVWDVLFIMCCVLVIYVSNSWLFFFFNWSKTVFGRLCWSVVDERVCEFFVQCVQINMDDQKKELRKYPGHLAEMLKTTPIFETGYINELCFKVLLSTSIPKTEKIRPEQLNECRITQNNVDMQWLPSSVVCCQMTSYFEKQKCLNKRGIDDCVREVLLK